MPRTNGFARVVMMSLTLTAMLFHARPAAADWLAVVSAHPDTREGMLIINGFGFKKGLYLGIDGQELTVVSVSPNEIRATLPPLAPGTYRLSIRQSRDQAAGFFLTIGTAGPQGPQGLPGPAGPQGPQGFPGPVGPQGLQGLTGLVGPQGAAGLQGLTGPAGPQGLQGLTGPAGPAGPVGPQGLAGPAGPAGAVGPQGATGPAGLQGPQGLTGVQGLKGDTGPAGPAGGLSVFSAAGQPLGPVIGLTKFTGDDPAYVVRNDNGVWVAIALDSTNILSGAFPIFYLDTACQTQPYAMAENSTGSPVPLLRSLQRIGSDLVGFYPGNPVKVQAFLAYSFVRNPTGSACHTTVPNSGWGVPVPAGPLKTIDLTNLMGPFTVQ